jgi:diphthamide biosynthesis protein 7
MGDDGFDTILPACSLEFCPATGQERFFAVGTYKLEDGNDVATGSQHRIGECLIFEIDDSTDAVPTLSVLL